MVQATKQTGIHICPKILVVHFKRFEGTGWAAKKITTPIEYPDVIDSVHITGNRNGAKYELIGAVFHSGTLFGGHYTAAALNQKENQWYSYNDAYASIIDRKQAHSEKAYILFYENRK
jgi:ubiquitin C-terminal hydrolase